VADVNGRLNFTAAELANSPYLQALPPGETILLPISNDTANELQQEQQQLQQQQPDLPPVNPTQPGSTKKVKKSGTGVKKDAVATAWDQNEMFADANDPTGGGRQYPAVYQQPAAAAACPGGSAAVAAAAAAATSVVDLDSETDSNHDTALTLACAGGHEELVTLLLEKKAQIGMCPGLFLFIPSHLP
jgi:ankyrin repeat domain-containing protein 17